MTAPSIREALERLLMAAKMLQQSAEGCAVNHHDVDFEQQGMPGWLRDTKADIDAAQSALASLSILATGLASDEAAIRADERERCAEIADCMADEYDATSFASTNADQVAAIRSKEQAAHEIAAAIRAGRDEG